LPSLTSLLRQGLLPAYLWWAQIGIEPVALHVVQTLSGIHLLLQGLLPAGFPDTPQKLAPIYDAINKALSV
jgi:hypothetical protein